MPRRFAEYTAIGPFHPEPYVDYQASTFQPESEATFDSPFWGMAMYGGFVNTRYASWIPAYQPGIPTPASTWGMGYYGGFVNEHKFPQ